MSLDELFARADAITVHVPKTKETTKLLGRDAFAKMKHGVLVVNAARGGIVDEAALLEALDAGQVGGAALDVFEQEPPPKDHPLVQHPRVICTPHLGASTEQAQLNVSIAVAEQVRDFLATGAIRNAVNVPSVSPELLEQVRPYLRLGEKLGRFQSQLSPGAIEEIEIEYAGEVAELRVAPITIAVLKGLLERFSDRVNMVNAPLIAQERGIRVIEIEVEPPDRLRERDHHARARHRRSADRRRDLPRPAAAHRAHRRLHARGDPRRPDHPDLQPRQARRGGRRWARCSARRTSTSRACSSAWSASGSRPPCS